MILFKTQVNEFDEVAFSEVIEEVFARIEGAYEWDLDSFETIQTLERREISIDNEEGETIARVLIDCYPNDEYDEDDFESGKYIVETELLEGELNPLFFVYTTQEAAEKWGLAEVTVRQWIYRGKFRVNEARKSAGTWLVTHAGMMRVAGEPKK